MCVVVFSVCSQVKHFVTMFCSIKFIIITLLTSFCKTFWNYYHSIFYYDIFITYSLKQSQKHKLIVFVRSGVALIRLCVKTLIEV